MVLQFLVQLSILFFIVSYVEAGVQHHYWDYSSEYGPGNWSKNFPKCNGTRQSPINIENSKAIYDENLGNITFENYGKPNSTVNFTATNNGHSFSVGFSGYTNETVPTIKDGGLPGTFKLIAYHFHWGAHGAEHDLDNHAHRCELHMVHMNTKYATLHDAINKSDGLAVLGIFVSEGKKNDVFDKFLNLTKYNVTYPGMSSQVQAFNLMLLIPSNHAFYRYNGSLTTPKCQESVTWTVFDNDLEISELQFRELSKMMYLDKNKEFQPMVDNDRPIQPLNGRIVKRNFAGYGNATMTTPLGNKTMTTTLPTSATTPTEGSTTDDGNGISGNLILMITSLFLVAMFFLEM